MTHVAKDMWEEVLTIKDPAVQKAAAEKLIIDTMDYYRCALMVPAEINALLGRHTESSIWLWGPKLKSPMSPVKAATVVPAEENNNDYW